MPSNFKCRLIRMLICLPILFMQWKLMQLLLLLYLKGGQSFISCYLMLLSFRTLGLTCGIITTCVQHLTLIARFLVYFNSKCSKSSVLGILAWKIMLLSKLLVQQKSSPFLKLLARYSFPISTIFKYNLIPLFELYYSISFSSLFEIIKFRSLGERKEVSFSLLLEFWF